MDDFLKLLQYPNKFKSLKLNLDGRLLILEKNRKKIEQSKVVNSK